MRRLFCLLVLFCGFLTEAGATYVHGIRIDVTLERGGSARVSERWDVTADRGTEWYLVKGNLDHIRISDFSVTEEGRPFTNIGKWDIDRNLAQKSGKCGIVTKSKGCELCWGLGSMGRHTFVATYRLYGLVEAFHDADGLHFQFVSPGIDATVESVEVRILPGEGVAPLTSGNTRIWAFGYDGTFEFQQDGSLMARASGRFTRESSVILLTRFDKGLFAPAHTPDKAFSEVLERAMDGSDFGEDGSIPWYAKLLLVLFTVIIPVLGIIAIVVAVRKRNRKLFGVTRLSQIDWCRDIPFGGDILQSSYILRKVNSTAGNSTVAGAMILRMIEHGQLSVLRSGKDGRRVEIAFSEDASLDSLSRSEQQLYEMMKEAAGSDRILQKHEFSRWSARNSTTIYRWLGVVQTESRKRIVDNGHDGEGGQVEARKVIGLKKFLKDFTLI